MALVAAVTWLGKNNFSFPLRVCGFWIDEFLNRHLGNTYFKYSSELVLCRMETRHYWVFGLREEKPHFRRAWLYN